ncbi:MAG: hypothetical protein LBB81_10805 [Treponema sp.]|jgi:hypothetical protein|nr:hypothetical protein [Treponema sp.]
MYDLEKREQETSPSVLSKQGLNAVICAGAGVGLFILQLISRLKVVGLIAGVAVCAVGIGALLSKDPSDKKPGAVITAAGALVLLSKIGFLAPVAGTLLSIGAVGLIAVGIYNGIKFLTGLKRRSE